MARELQEAPRSHRLIQLGAVVLATSAAALAFGRVFAGRATAGKLLLVGLVSIAVATLFERRSPLLLSSTVRTNNAVLDVDLTNPDIQHGETLVLAKDTIHITRMKFLWNAACYELLVARNFGEQTHTLRMDFDFDADFLHEIGRERFPFNILQDGCDSDFFIVS